ERPTVVADRDDDNRRVCGALVLGARLSERPQERECLQVDPGQPQPRLLAGGDVAIDQLAIGNDEQDAHDRVALVVGPLAEDVVVEHRLLDRNRQHLLGTETDGVLELPWIGDAGDLEDPDSDAVVGDPEPDALARQAVLAEERAQRVRQQLWLAQLAADDQAVVDVLAPDLDELGRAVVDDPRGGDLRSADLEPDQALRALLPAACAPGATAAPLLLRLLLRRVGLVQRALGLRLALERELLLEQRGLWPVLALRLALLRGDLRLGLGRSGLLPLREQVRELDLLLQVHA